jgi:hypothetical protein
MVNLVAVLNTKLDHAHDELAVLSKARAEIAELRAEHVERRRRRMVPPPLSGLSTLTARCPVVVMLMPSLTAGPR